MRGALRGVLGLCVVAAACTGGEQPHEPAGEPSPISGQVSVSTNSPSSFPAPYIVAQELHGRREDAPVELRGQVAAELIGLLAPAAVPRDGTVVLYNSSLKRGPALRAIDTTTSRQSIVARGALSVAVRSDGTLAYFQGSRPTLTQPQRFRGHVIVRADGRTRGWTTRRGRYVVAAWADRRLLVYRLRPGWPDLLVLDGPGRVRRLARAGALVAVGPDGDRALVSTYGASPARLRLFELDGRRPLTKLTLSAPVDGTPVEWLTESGSWVGDVAAVAGSSGIVVIRVNDAALSVEQLLRFDESGFVLASEPRLQGSGRYVIVRVELEARPREAVPRTALLRCDRSTLRCVQGPAASTADGLSLVYNPSRP